MVSDEDLAKIIDAGKRAPSAGGIYPVEFAIVKDQTTKEKLAPTMDFITQAPVVLVIYADTEKTAAKYGQKGKDLYVIQDAAATAENIFLAAIALGLSACWVGAFDERVVREVLRLKENERPMVIMPIGYK